MQQSNLARAIRIALSRVQLPNNLDLDQIRELARLAQLVNEEAITFLADLKTVRTEREYVANQLFRASFDHGRGLLFLIHTNPLDMCGPALALHRSQIENFLRGAYLGFLADDEQLQDFLESDDGIRERNLKGKWQTIGPIRLASKVETLIDSLGELNDSEEKESSLSVMVENAWTPLCGMVHGGKAVRAFYEDGQGQIGADIPLPIMVHTIRNCYAITNFGFILVIAKIYGLEGIPRDSAFAKATANFIRFLKSIE